MTPGDWILAAAALPPEARAATLHAALDALRDAGRVRDLVQKARAERLLGPRDPWLARAADRLLALGAGEPWAFRDAAALRDALGDRDGARDALERGLDPAQPAWYAILIAEGFAALDGPDAARRVLDGARRQTLSDRCDLARAYIEAGDPGAARAELRGLTPEDGFEAWALAGAWRALSDQADPADPAEADPAVLADPADPTGTDPAEADPAPPSPVRDGGEASSVRDGGEASSVLAAALARWSGPGGAPREVLTLARAASSLGMGDLRDRALAEAGRRAADGEAWLELAETAFDLHHPFIAEEALTRAEACGADPGRLAAVWGWLDPDRAERFGEVGVRPADARARLRAWPGADPAPLLDRLRARLTDADLDAIASADYGSGFAKHRSALERARRTGRLPRPLRWEPGEVLRLSRWSEGPDTDHRRRAFCAAILALCDDDSPGWDNFVLLAESVREIGEPQMTEDARAFFAHLYEVEREPDGQLAALWARALLDPEPDGSAGGPDPGLERAEEAVREGASAADVLAYGLKADLWRALSAGLSARWRARVG